MKRKIILLLVLVGVVLASGIAFAGDPSLYEISAIPGQTRIYDLMFSKCVAPGYVVTENTIHMKTLFAGCGSDTNPAYRSGCYGTGYVFIQGSEQPKEGAVLLHEVSLTAAQKDKVRELARRHIQDKGYDPDDRERIYAGLEKIFPGVFTEERYVNLLQLADKTCECNRKYAILQKALSVKPSGQEAYWTTAEIERRGQTDFAGCDCRYLLTDDWQKYTSGGVVQQQPAATTATPIPPTPVPTNTPVPPSLTPVPPTKVQVPTATKKPMFTATPVVVVAQDSPKPTVASMNPGAKGESFGDKIGSFLEELGGFLLKCVLFVVGCLVLYAILWCLNVFRKVKQEEKLDERARVYERKEREKQEAINKFNWYVDEAEEALRKGDLNAARKAIEMADLLRGVNPDGVEIVTRLSVQLKEKELKQQNRRRKK